jgi:cellulose synthase/poly-beta-1,6-N-acetylglucosamine synthase-like glycosyltransferase
MEPVLPHRRRAGSGQAALRLGVGVLGLAVATVDAYLLLLLAAATRSSAGHVLTDDPLRFVVLVPAHDEEAMIGRTLAALARVEYPRERWSLVVIADNCRDATAGIAARAGATVLERHDPDRRGKAFALNWALDRLAHVAGDAQAVAIVDADCEPSSNLLAAMNARLRSGACAVQVRYEVSNPDASPQTALRFAAFALMNTVRPLGKERLGLSSGLLGTGMAFLRPLLERHRFAERSLVEDAELHLRLVANGERVAFVSEASVRSPMPTGAAAIQAQQSRWEGGRMSLLRAWTAPLLATGTRRRDAVRLHAWFELLVPPQSVLALLHVAFGLLAVAARGRRRRRLAALAAACQAIFVLGGLRVTRAPRSVYRALAHAPVLVVQKIQILSRLAVKGAPRSWERTARDEVRW